jgi:hypothetical protein
MSRDKIIVSRTKNELGGGKMTGRGLVPYKEYAQATSLEIKRICADYAKAVEQANTAEKTKKNWYLRFWAVAGFGVILMLIAVGQKGDGQANTFMVGIAALFVLAPMAGYAYLEVFRSSGSLFGGRLEEVYFRCPHCGGQMDVTQAWDCGWCGATNKEGLIFNGCQHSVCGKEPNAIRCPDIKCKQDIILDENLYVRAKRESRQRIPGVATFVGLPALFSNILTAAIEQKSSASSSPPNSSRSQTTRLDRDIS